MICFGCFVAVWPLNTAFLLLYSHRYVFALCNKYGIHMARQCTMRTMRIHVLYSCIVRTTPQRSIYLSLNCSAHFIPYVLKTIRGSWKNNIFLDDVAKIYFFLILRKYWVFIMSLHISNILKASKWRLIFSNIIYMYFERLYDIWIDRENQSYYRNTFLLLWIKKLFA